MKLITFVLTLLVATLANAKPTFTTGKITPNSKLLELRGGGSVGPVDADLLSKVGSTSLALYIGSSASKWVASQTGGSAPDVSVPPTLQQNCDQIIMMSHQFRILPNLRPSYPVDYGRLYQ